MPDEGGQGMSHNKMTAAQKKTKTYGMQVKQAMWRQYIGWQGGRDSRGKKTKLEFKIGFL